MKDLEKWMPKKEEGYSFYKDEYGGMTIVTPYEIPATGEKIFLKVLVEKRFHYGNIYVLEMQEELKEYIDWDKERFILEGVMLSMTRTKYFHPIKYDKKLNPKLKFTEPYHLIYNIRKFCNFIIAAISVSYSDIEESDI